MARDFSAQTGIDTSDPTNFPNGRVKDTVGPTAGTAWKEAITGDFTQFFQKLLIDAGITANDDPDSVGNGYQLIDALINMISKKGIKRVNTETEVNGAMTTTPQIILTSVLSADDNFDDIKVVCTGKMTSKAGGSSGDFFILSIEVDGVEQHAQSQSVFTDSRQEMIAIVASGIAYTAGDVVTIVGATTAETCDVSAMSMVVEGINV
jgi:hypothetical protein